MPVFCWNSANQGYPQVEAGSHTEAVAIFQGYYHGWAGNHVHDDKVFEVRYGSYGPMLVLTCRGYVIDGPRRTAPLSKRGEKRGK